MRRAYCSRCNTWFTFLPVFLAPAKWYGYSKIEEALAFISRPEFATFNAAVTQWGLLRVDREEDEKDPGPSESTIRRWWNELGQDYPNMPWLRRAKDEASQRSSHKPLASPSSEASDVPSYAERLLVALRKLGELVAKSVTSLFPVPLLGLGLWAVEGPHRQRCLASVELTGRVIPGRMPESGSDKDGPDLYPSESSSPP